MRLSVSFPERLTMSADEIETWIWERERSAAQMAAWAHEEGKLQFSLGWLREAERLRQMRWPKDRPYSPLYLV